MSSRKARLSLVAFLLIVGAAGAYLGFDTYRRHTQVFSDERVSLAHLDQMLSSVNELAVTQRGYFEPGRGGSVTGSSGDQFQRVRQLTEELRQGQDSLRARLTNPEALEQLTILASALDAFATTDTRVRTNLANETYFSAADLVFSASATELRSVTTALITLKQLTSRTAAEEFDRLQKRAATVAGGLGVVWTLGLLLLGLPGAKTERPAEAVALLIQEPEPVVAGGAEVVAPVATDPPPASSPSLDLERVSQVCGLIAKAASATELREAMADAAGALGASGLIVWLGAGEELFPVLGHGYDPRMLARIGPLSRHADNATAMAWRNAEPEVVAADQGRAGAIVVPLVSAQGCIGVLSAEVNAGRERDATTHAVTTLFAAQLSGIVAAWPEPSSTAADDGAAHTGTVAVRL